MREAAHKILLGCIVTCLVGCGGVEPEAGDEGVSTASGLVEQDRVFFATDVHSFEPGEHAGFGQNEMPEVVLGAPEGGGERKGSLDVVTLGVGGRITLEFGRWDVRDGPGVDFVVFENAFVYLDTMVFSEPGEVSVSVDGETWVSFPCQDDGTGCAGMSPTLEFDPMNHLIASEAMGGDGFDLADVGMPRARYVRITDRASQGAPPSAGFDLDAVAGVHGISR